MKQTTRSIGLTLCTLSFMMLFCTIRDDNGTPVPLGPTDQITSPTSPFAKAPAIFASAESAYVRISDTMNIRVQVLSDSTAITSTPLASTRIIARRNSGTLLQDTLLSDSNGRAIFKFRDTVAGRIELTFYAQGAQQTVRFEVTNTPDKVQKNLIALSERPNILADGKDFTTIEVRVIDKNHNPVAGECIQFVTTRGIIIGDGTACGKSGQSKTDAEGLAKGKLIGSTINDTAYVTAYLVSDPSQSDETTVAFQGVRIDISIDKSNIKINDTVIITARVMNASDIPVARSSIFFRLGQATKSNLQILSFDSTTGFDGRAMAKVKGLSTGTDSISISSSGATGATRINVSNLRLTLALNKTVIQTKEADSATLTATFAKSDLTVLSARTVTMTRKFKTEGGVDTSDQLKTTTNSAGKAIFSISALPFETMMRLEMIAFDPTEGYASADTFIQFITTRVMTMKAIPSIIQADGSSKSQITVYVKNKNNNPIVGDAVVFSATAGVITSKAITDESGRAIGYLTSDRRNTIAHITAMLESDIQKRAELDVEFAGVSITALANPPSIRASGKDTATVIIALLDAMKNPIPGERLNFSKQQDKTIIVKADSVTNTRGEALCKIVGTGTGTDTIKISAAGALSYTVINYSSHLLSIDTAAGQHLIANGKDSTSITVTYLTGAGAAIVGASVDISATIGSLDTVFARKYTTNAQGKVTLYLKNPSFANNATIFAQARSANETTTSSFKLYFKSSTIYHIKLMGTPEVVGTNGGKAKITAVAYDSSGNRVKDARISFNILSGPGGGEFLDPATAITAEDGSATSYLVSGKTPSNYRQVAIVAGDFSAVKSDTVKFTIAGAPRYITIRTNILKGKNPNDGTFILPCAAIVTDVNGNPVADGTEVTFSLKVSGYVVNKFAPLWIETAGGGFACYSEIDTIREILPFEDLNDNFKADPGEDRNGDGLASRGEDYNGDGKYQPGPAYIDVNGDGRRQFNPFIPVEELYMCSNGMQKYADLNRNGVWDPIEPLTNSSYLAAYHRLLADSAFMRYPTIRDAADSADFAILTAQDQAYKTGPGYTANAGHYDINSDGNGIADPNTAVSITRTVQTISGKALNEIIYGQSDATKIEVKIWAESQGVVTETPEQIVLPIVMEE